MQNKLKILFLIFLCFSFALLAGCGKISHDISTKRANFKSDYLNLESFCKRYGLAYQYNTVDDIIKLYSKTTKADLLISSSIGVIDGNFFSLKRPILQKNGKIFIPEQFQTIFQAKSYKSQPFFQIKTVMVDPGHGGKDPGAISRSGLKEKTINLIVSKILKKELEQKGFKVYLTRETDTYLSLKERVELAKKYRCDLFISIHANANNSLRVKGIEVYYLRSNELDSLRRAKKLSKLNYFIDNKSHPGAETILWDLNLTKNYQLSVLTSNSLYFTFHKLDFDVKAPREANFYVLRNAYVPAVLFEMGYLTNQDEERFLRNSYYQKQIAQTIVLALNSLNKKLD
ncbi:MAG: N-acetylmuramoyl-L-alanine amidase [Candidatus Omnitrophica bacterium]|nr:N-acetylmuramoyl-L-alanine amidase [Candidatus Omnitrophota bacterium]MCF7893902.1 N-acetylmuramoyl-L-alanine amidase [Candidatus Omnitrophota bacterium]